ncbi:MAG: hypothetical protein ACREM3_16915 [Candidatus Rokuibacteriota bacterium]
MIRALPLALLPLLLLPLAGCATSTAPPERVRSGTPQVRCLVGPEEYPTRPMFFLFCTESP